MISLKTSKAILALGDVNPDIVLPYGESKRRLKALSKEGQAELTDQPRATIYAGGTAGNTASAVSRLGCKSYFAGVSGNDSFADFLTKEFEADGVDCEYYVKKNGLFTPLVTAVIDEDKERILYVWPTEGAAHHQVYPQDIPDDVFEKIGWVHTSGISLREDPCAETVLSFLESCKGRGIIVSLDLNLRIEEMGFSNQYYENVMRAVETAHVIFGSGVEEICPLTGKDTPRAAARSLVRSDRMVVCREGKNGVRIYTDQEELDCPAYQVELVDTIGAGDGSNAGFIVAASEGLSMHDCAQWSNGVAAYVLQFIGARSGPSREQLHKLMKEVPVFEPAEQESY